MVALPLLVLFAVPVRAAEPALSWAEVAAAVEAANPELAGARSRAEAGRARIASSWAPASPVLALESMYSNAEKSWSVSQAFALPPALALRRGAALSAAGAEAQRALGKRRELLSRARAAFAGLRFAWAEADILDQNLELLRRVARVAEAKLAAGRASQTDALKAQVELSKMTGLREAALRERAAGEAELGALMGRAPGAPLGRPEAGGSAPAQDEAALEREALANRPELRAAVLEAERAGQAAALARAEVLPELMLQYRRRDAPMTGRTYDAMVGFSVPLWAWRPAAAIREADAARGMARSEAEAARLATLAEVRAGYERWTGAARLAEVYRTTILPQADSALRTAETAYQSDRAGFLDLLDAQRTLWDLTLEYQKAVADGETRRAELERAVGREL